jgi:hypothetical protein
VKKTTSEQFCQDLLKSLDIKYAKAFTNTVIALSSYDSAQSVVELSESPLFHHQYSSLRDGIHGIGNTEEEQSRTMAALRHIVLSQISYSKEEWLLLQTDASGVSKAHSACLEDRQYIKIANNVIKDNKPISIGYPISLVNVSIPPLGNKWSLPVSIKRIVSTQSAVECAVEQVSELQQQENLELAQQSIINTLDSGYGCPNYIEPTYKHKNLVNIIRFRYGKKVWQPAQCANFDNGAPLVYGEKYYLIDFSAFKTYTRKGAPYQVYQRSIFDLVHQDYIELDGQTAKGRNLKIMIWRWTNLLVRTKDGHNMKDKAFDLIASKVIDADTGQLVFNKTMFTTIHGQRKDEITTQQAFESYRHRYDIEPSIKFCKQKLLLEKYQTPDKQHFDNWLVVVMAAFWLLFTAASSATYKPKKWQKYKAVNKKATEPNTILTPSQVRQAAQDFFLTFDSTPFLPVKCKNGPGRQKGTPINQRTRYFVVKKSTPVIDSS